MTGDLEFSDVIADVLKEVGNIGAAHAATALSVLLEEEVRMTVPSARMVPFHSVPDLVGGTDVQTAGMFIAMDGELGGNLLLMMSAPSAAKVVSRLSPTAHSQIDEFDAMDFSVLAEVGNILGGSFINAVSQLTSHTFHLSVPGVAIDTAEAILNMCLLSNDATASEALIVDARISQGTDAINAHMILIPNRDAMAPLLTALGC